MDSDRYRNEYHVIEFLFRVDEWSGTLETETDESVNAAFFSLDQLPEASNAFFANHHKRVFEDLENFDGSLLVR